jgi:hypothetical protein
VVRVEKGAGRLGGGDGFAEEELTKRTLTNLYKERPTWLANAHERLDVAVLTSYGWPVDIDDQDLLERLLELNLSRPAA